MHAVRKCQSTRACKKQALFRVSVRVSVQLNTYVYSIVDYCSHIILQGS